MGNVLIVVDMLEGFLRPEYPLFCGEDAEKIIPFVKGKIEKYGEAGESEGSEGLVIFIADNHEDDDLEFERFPKHCVAGTKEAEVIGELKGIAKKETLITKKRYSGFFGTDLEEVLEKEKPELVEVVGVCTNICVLYTVEELKNRDYNVKVYKDGVASFDKAAHEWSLKQMESVLGAEVV